MGFFVVIIAIGLISRGASSALRNAWFSRNSIPAKGTVVANESGGITQKSYFPVVEFKDEGGRRRRFRSDFGACPPLYQPGDRVPIRYIRTQPDRARIERGWQIWWDCVGFAGFGFAALALGMRLLGLI